MEERRLLLAVALSLLVLTAYSLLFAPTPAAVGATGAVPAPPAVAAPAPAGRAGAPRRRRRSPEPAAGRRPWPTSGSAASRSQGPDYAVAFTNRGARLVSWTLARLPDARGRPEEMVPAQGAGRRGRSTSRPGTRPSTRGCARRCSSPRPRRSTVSGAEPRDAALRVLRRRDRGARRRCASARRASWR